MSKLESLTYYGHSLIDTKLYLIGPLTSMIYTNQINSRLFYKNYKPVRKKMFSHYKRVGVWLPVTCVLLI